MSNDRTRVDALERELVRLFMQMGVHPVDCLGHKYIGVGTIGVERDRNGSRVYPVVREDDRVVASLDIGKLADHIINVWDGR